MAAPKAGGMLFRGDLQGGAETRRASCRVHVDGEWIARQTKAEARPPPGAACLSLAVPERTCRTRGSMQHCQHTSNCNNPGAYIFDQ